ncbi:MAG: cytochrome c1, partial [Pseudomonadota bacterium]
NNLVFKDVGMPHVLQELQGDQECLPAIAVAANGGLKKDKDTGEYKDDLTQPCARVRHVEGTGLLSTEGYAQKAYDLTNFLTYMGNPVAEKSKSIGVRVMFFLAFLLVWVLLLNREYWKDIH